MKGLQSVKGIPAACAALLAALLVTGAAHAQTTQLTSGGGNRWVATWGSAPIEPGPHTIDVLLLGNDRSRSFDNQTVRNVLHASVGGRRVRVRLSNAFGVMPLRVGAASVAISRGGAAINPATSRRLTFGGLASTVVPAGALAVSDPVDLNVPSAADLAVSVYLPGPTEPATYHEITLTTSFVTGTGNFTAAADLPTATATPSTFYLTAVEVQPNDPVGTLVVLGDSISQGAGSTENAHTTWPDQLSARLNSGRARLSVVNQAIGCGRLLFDFCGPGGAARFDRDVLATTGASHVIVELGLNDLMIPSILPIFGHPEFGPETVSAADIIAGLQQLIQRARAQNLRVYGATITPNGSSPVPGAFTPENEAKRTAVNRWIRTSGAFDGVIDFDAVVRDPANPTQLLPAWSFDGVHLNDSGYEAMANAVNLSMFF